MSVTELIPTMEPLPAVPLAPISVPESVKVNKRLCTRCHGHKPETQFSFIKHVTGQPKLHSWCDPCRRDYNNRWMREYRKRKRVGCSRRTETRD